MLLDASKAFDRVNSQMGIRLESCCGGIFLSCSIDNVRNCDTLISLLTSSKWGSKCSGMIFQSLELKQGGVLSPILFSVYLDAFHLVKLQDSGRLDFPEIVMRGCLALQMNFLFALFAFPDV